MCLKVVTYVAVELYGVVAVELYGIVGEELMWLIKNEDKWIKYSQCIDQRRRMDPYFIGLDTKL